MMKIAVMQPYVFPYIGYFQMIYAVDQFVFYDDVNFIKQSWINRNRILLNNNVFLFTIPLHKANSFCLIKDTLINENLYNGWKSKMLRSINQSYKKAPEFEVIYSMLEVFFNAEYETISEMAIESVKLVSSYLGIQTDFKKSSEAYQNKELERQERLIDICKQEKANHYINALGGQELYKKENFLKEEIELEFIKSLPIEYKQFKNDFIPWLSIIDVLMFNSKEEVKGMLGQYELI